MTLNPWAWVQAMIDKTRHPVGYIFEWDGTGLDGAPDLTTPEKVALYFGYGVWERYGDGRVTVGVVDGKYAAGATGGEEKNTLTEAEMPPHKHRWAKWGYTVAGDHGDGPMGNNGKNVLSPAGGADLGMLATGGGQPHNNMQPYIVVYRWRRVA